MLAVGAGVTEGLATLGALEGLLTAVEALVLGQVVLVLESLRTRLASEWPLACGGGGCGGGGGGGGCGGGGNGCGGGWWW